MSISETTAPELDVTDVDLTVLDLTALDHEQPDELLCLVVDRAALADHLRLVLPRQRRDAGVLACLRPVELSRLREHHGPAEVSRLLNAIASMVARVSARPTVLSVDGDELLVLVPSGEILRARRRLAELAATLATTPLPIGDEHVHLTLAVGLAPLAGATDGGQVLARARRGTDASASTMDLVPRVGDAADPSTVDEEITAPRRARRRLSTTGLLVVATFALGWGVPLALYELAWRLGVDVSPAAYLLVVVATLATAVMVWAESLRAVEPTVAPSASPTTSATAVIAAFLPNEAATIEGTLAVHLAQEHPGGLQVLLAYNTPHRLPVEDRLEALAAREPRLQLLKVEGSTSKAQNVNAALGHVQGDVVGIFDADHEPAPGSFARAAGWLENGYDVVQGRCVVRNGASSPVSATVATEFELIYGVSHPGRARLHGFGIFGGSNGYWRTEALRTTRFRQEMLTEDIDSAIRAVRSGLRIASDPGLVSTELAPTTVKALWRQRLRWAQGWHQVAIVRLRGLVTDTALSLRQRAGMVALLGWSQVAPWISMQIVPLVAFALLHPAVDLAWFAPLLVATTLVMASSGIAQLVIGHHVAHPSVRAHRAWWFAFLVLGLSVYSEFKNVGVRVAHLRELFGQQQWVVTPRAVSVAPTDTAAVPATA